MEVSKEEMEVVVLLLQSMTTYDTGCYGLGFKQKVILQLMYGRFSDAIGEDDDDTSW